MPRLPILAVTVRACRPARRPASDPQHTLNISISADRSKGLDRRSHRRRGTAPRPAADAGLKRTRDRWRAAASDGRTRPRCGTATSCVAAAIARAGSAAPAPAAAPARAGAAQRAPARRGRAPAPSAPAPRRSARAGNGRPSAAGTPGASSSIVRDRLRLAADQQRAAPRQDAAAGERAAADQAGPKLLEQPLEARPAWRVRRDRRRVITTCWTARRRISARRRRRAQRAASRTKPAGSMRALRASQAAVRSIVRGTPPGLLGRAPGEARRIQPGAAAQPRRARTPAPGCSDPRATAGPARFRVASKRAFGTVRAAGAAGATRRARAPPPCRPGRRRRSGAPGATRRSPPDRPDDGRAAGAAPRPRGTSRRAGDSALRARPPGCRWRAWRRSSAGRDGRSGARAATPRPAGLRAAASGRRPWSTISALTAPPRAARPAGRRAGTGTGCRGRPTPRPPSAGAARTARAPRSAPANSAASERARPGRLRRTRRARVPGPDACWMWAGAFGNSLASSA